MNALRAFRTATLVWGLAVVLFCLAYLGCSGNPAPPCATAIVANYTAEMIAADCHGEHFNDPQCAPIRAKYEAEAADAGCK